jgi:hypothetical protein
VRVRASDRPSERPADDVHDLVDASIGLAPRGGGSDAPLDVVLEHEDGATRRPIRT